MQHGNEVLLASQRKTGRGVRAEKGRKGNGVSLAYLRLTAADCSLGQVRNGKLLNAGNAIRLANCKHFNWKQIQSGFGGRRTWQ
jgi:hypothetical protein